MTDWKAPSKEIVNHDYAVIIFDIEYDDDLKREEMDIFYYNGIYGIFISTNRDHEIKYKEIKYWIPLPKKPRR